MIPVQFHFQGSLVDFLARQHRDGTYSTEVTLRSGMLDAIQAQGVPHVEVGRLLRNGTRASWSDLVEAADRIEAFPWAPWQTPGVDNAPPPPLPPAFLLDIHLGKLAGHLRLLGFDSAYPTPDIGDKALVQRAVTESRVLLTCDRHLLMHRALPWGVFLRSRDPERQAAELLERFSLHALAKPFTRCTECNGLLETPSSEHVRRQAPPLVRLRLGVTPSVYRACPSCGRLYWPGTHWQKMVRRLKQWGIPWVGPASR